MYSDIYNTSTSVLGRTQVIQHEIATGTSRPIRQRVRRSPVHCVTAGRNHLEYATKESHPSINLTLVVPYSVGKEC
ncbi:unnamed protein product [Echinostoma caproni]|uniref:Uncharacterized protein n=1 Tax=Echinostoma caproni TaxID=27848 RepID=A0A183A7S5_9TREM|nr:unnamed protein product [Echinostoma caproni]